MRDHWLGDLALLTVLLGLFFCFGLGGRALWAPDEGRYSEVAREMVLSGEPIDAGRALSLGLITRVVPPDKLAAETASTAARLAAQPAAASAAKEAMSRGAGLAFDSGLRLEAALAMQLRQRRASA